MDALLLQNKIYYIEVWLQMEFLLSQVNNCIDNYFCQLLHQYRYNYCPDIGTTHICIIQHIEKEGCLWITWQTVIDVVLKLIKISILFLILIKELKTKTSKAIPAFLMMIIN